MVHLAKHTNLRGNVCLCRISMSDSTCTAEGNAKNIMSYVVNYKKNYNMKSSRTAPLLMVYIKTWL